ncbi:MAG: TonB-dependent receptor [Alphaproteobacteria bacterium]|nr:TonB-dependent receptor [Alphaproteobacteria bacterium]
MENRSVKAALGLLSAMMLYAPTDAQAVPAAPAGSSPSTDQPMTIETVTVTARRRIEDLERVPVAETVLAPETIRAENVRSAIDLQILAPSLTVSANLGSRDDNVFTIRGQSQPFGGADPGVQSYFNEVPFGASGPGNYFDMDNIQVLRGPQGTLFGRNTTGGAVLFEPKKPSDRFGGYLDGQWGDFAMHEVQGAVNLPLIDDKLMMRIAADTARRDGYTKDLSTGSDLDNVSYDAFRIGVTVKPFEGFENYLAFNYLNNHDHGTGAELTAIAPESVLQSQFGGEVTALVLPAVTQNLVDIFTNPPYSLPLPVAQVLADAQAPAIAAAQAQAQIHGIYTSMFQPALAAQQALGVRQTMSTIPLFYRRHVWSLTDTAQYDVAEHLRLRNIFGYLSDKIQPSFDYDGSAMPLLEIPNSRTWEQNSRQITEELQLLGETDDGIWNWIAGFYYEHDYRGGYAEVERDVFGGGSSGNPLGSTEVDALANGGTSLAAYGNVTLDASHWVGGLSFTGGGRFTWDHKVATAISCIQPAGYPACQYPLTAAVYGQQVNSASFHAPTWNLGANWQASDDTLLYATWRRGYKSGGFNSGATGTNYLQFKPEFLTDVEVGTKNNWEILGVPGRTNFDVYYGWYQNIQKNDIVGFANVPRAPVVLTVNAARATIKGLEFESTFIPNENVQLSAFYSYTDASYDSFVLPAALDGVTGAVLGLDDHKGAPFAYTPKHKLGITGRFHLPVDATWGKPYVTATWYWQSKVWFTDLSKVSSTSFNPFDFEPDAYQPDYGLINLRLDWDGIMGSSFDAGAFVNNVTNKTYKVGANALEHQIGTTASIFGAPRMFGIELRYRFGADAGP